MLRKAVHKRWYSMTNSAQSAWSCTFDVFQNKRMKKLTYKPTSLPNLAALSDELHGGHESTLKRTKYGTPWPGSKMWLKSTLFACYQSCLHPKTSWQLVEPCSRACSLLKSLLRFTNRDGYYLPPLDFWLSEQLPSPCWTSMGCASLSELR